MRISGSQRLILGAYEPLTAWRMGSGSPGWNSSLELLLPVNPAIEFNRAGFPANLYAWVRLASKSVRRP